jgi:hypothetical protein
MTRAQYQSGNSGETAAIVLTSQVTQWQTSILDRPPLSGWGGRCADLWRRSTGRSVSLSITLAGANTFEVGNVISQYSVSTSGAINLSGVSGARLRC